MMRMVLVATLLAFPGLALADDKPAGAEKKLAELEAKLQGLLKEIQSLRAAPPGVAKKTEEKKSIVLELDTGDKKGEKKSIVLDLDTGKIQGKKDVVVETQPGKKVEKKDVIIEKKPGEKTEKKDVIVRIGPDGKAIAELIEGGKKVVEKLVVGKDGKPLAGLPGKTPGSVIERVEVVTDGKGTFHVKPVEGGKVVEKLVVGADGKPVLGIKTAQGKPVVVAEDAKGKPSAYVQGQTPLAWAQQGTFAYSSGDANTVHLTRVTYSLSGDQAKALDSFLKSFVKTSVMETKVEGDKIVVTTTPDVQATIGQVVGLMSGKSATARYRLSNTVPAVPGKAGGPTK